MGLETGNLLSGFEGIWEDFVSDNKTREIKEVQDKDTLEVFSKQFKMLFLKFIKKTGSTSIRDFLKLTFKPTTNEELSWYNRCNHTKYYSYGDIVIEYSQMTDKMVGIKKGNLRVHIELDDLLGG